MKINKILFIILLFSNFIFSQDNNSTESRKANSTANNSDYKLNPISINIGTGISIGTRPYTEGYFVNTNNKLFNDFKFNSFSIGGQYLFSKFIGVKTNLTFDHFTNNKKNKSKPFEMAQYRVSFAGILNLSALARPQKESTKFNIYVQSGIQVGSLDPIATDYNPKVSSGEVYGSIFFGITPSYKFSKKASVFIDLASFNNYGQNITWNAKHASGKESSVGNMYAVLFGVSFDIAKN